MICAWLDIFSWIFLNFSADLNGFRIFLYNILPNFDLTFLTFSIIASFLYHLIKTQLYMTFKPQYYHNFYYKKAPSTTKSTLTYAKYIDTKFPTPCIPPEENLCQNTNFNVLPKRYSVYYVTSRHSIRFHSIAKFIIALSCFETFLPSSTIKTFSSMLRCYLLSFQLSDAQKETSECDKIFFCPFLLLLLLILIKNKIK